MKRLLLSRASVCIMFCVALSNTQSRADEISRDLIEKVERAVVTIYCYNKAGHLSHTGTGFLYTVEAHLITNYHILGNVDMAKIKTRDGKEYSVETVIGEDKASDLAEALVDVPPHTVRFLDAAHAEPKSGDRVAVVGSPLGVEQTVSQGNVLNIREVQGHGRVIEYNAFSFHGSSGSPVVNSQGEVIGVVSFGYGPNLSFAIPAERISKLDRVWRQMSPAPISTRATNDSQSAVEREKQLADEGDPAALVRLAGMYEAGNGVSKDCSRAFDLYRKAADRGFTPAQYHVGRMYYESSCISKNSEQAAKWFGKAADRGYAEAQKALGVLYFNGEGIQRDKVQALKWIMLATLQGNQSARNTLRLFAMESTRDELKQAQDLARSWKPAK
jgi:TPR repeat protein